MAAAVLLLSRFSLVVIRSLILALGLVWLAHIGVWLAHIGADRLLGYGLKYDDNFQHTHLGQLGQPGATP